MQDSVARLAPCGLVELTEVGGITEANDLFLSWVSLPGEAVIGHDIFEFIENPDGLRSALQSDDWDGTPFTLSFGLKVGELPRPVLVASSAYREEGVVRMSVVFFDATQQTALAMQTAGDRDLAQRVNARLRVLVESAAEFSSATTEFEVASLLQKSIIDATGADLASVHLLADGSFEFVAGTNPLSTTYPELAPSLGEEAIRRGTPVFIQDPRAAEIFAPGWGLTAVFEAAGIHSVIVAPIVDIDDRIGAVAAFFASPPDFDDQVLLLVGTLARQAGQMIARLRLEEHLRRAANVDLVTGLANRRLLEVEISRSLLEEGTIAAFFLDLDGFKPINDTYGHDTGDLILAEVGRRIAAVIRDRDRVARYGGDEFVAICPVDDESSATTIAERIRAAVTLPYSGVVTADVTIGVSIGVAISRPPAMEIERLIRAADLAMYQAKEAGGNQVRLAMAS